MKRPAQDAPRSTAEQRLKPAIFVPERPPDDPGVAQTESDETSPNSLERLRAAQIRKTPSGGAFAANLASLRQWP